MGDFDCCAKPTPSHALDEANWKLAQIRDALAWAEPNWKVLHGIRAIIATTQSAEGSEPTA